MAKEQPYDEYQLLKRNKISFQTMILFAVLIGINGFIKEVYITWAPVLIEAFVLIYIPMFYFVLMSVIKNAYFGIQKNHVAILFGLGIVVIFNLLLLIPKLIDGTFTLVENGMLSDSIMQLSVILFFAMIGSAAIINRMKERRAA